MKERKNSNVVIHWVKKEKRNNRNVLLIQRGTSTTVRNRDLKMPDKGIICSKGTQTFRAHAFLARQDLYFSSFMLYLF